MHRRAAVYRHMFIRQLHCQVQTCYTRKWLPEIKYFVTHPDVFIISITYLMLEINIIMILAGLKFFKIVPIPLITSQWNLVRCGLVSLTLIINISGEGVLSDGTKPLPGAMMLCWQFTPNDKLQSNNRNQNIVIFNGENAFRNVTWKMSVILSQPQRVTHRSPVTNICVGDQTRIGLDNGLSPSRRHCLSQWWNIVNGTLRNKFQRNFIQNSYILVQKNVLGNVAWKTSAILSRLQCVKPTSPLAITSPAKSNGNLIRPDHWMNRIASFNS